MTITMTEREIHGVNVDQNSIIVIMCCNVGLTWSVAQFNIPGSLDSTSKPTWTHIGPIFTFGTRLEPLLVPSNGNVGRVRIIGLLKWIFQVLSHFNQVLNHSLFTHTFPPPPSPSCTLAYDVTDVSLAKESLQIDWCSEYTWFTNLLVPGGVMTVDAEDSGRKFALGLKIRCAETEYGGTCSLAVRPTQLSVICTLHLCGQ